MARDYAAYAKTPSGIAAIAKGRAKQQIKRGPSTRTTKIKPQALLKALANWRQND